MLGLFLYLYHGLEALLEVILKLNELFIDQKDIAQIYIKEHRHQT